MTLPHTTAAARLAAKLLAHRSTPQAEVPELIRNVHGALLRLGQSREAETPTIEPMPQSKRERPRALARRPRQPRNIVDDHAVSEPAEAAPSPPPVMPKLVRRAEVAAPSLPIAPPHLAAPPSHGIRGVVKWFDPRSGKGALRLPGIGDIGFEARVMAESGISRLFKGQEVEATLATEAGATQVQRLALPGAVPATPIAAGTVRSRHAKPVLVELKREALRRAAARAEAEHILGGPNRSR
jgi:cold shock CspA family protein